MNNIKSTVENVVEEIAILEKIERKIKKKKAQVLKKLSCLPTNKGKIYICYDKGIPYIRLLKKENNKRKLCRIRSPKDIRKLI